MLGKVDASGSDTGEFWTRENAEDVREAIWLLIMARANETGANPEIAVYRYNAEISESKDAEGDTKYKLTVIRLEQ
jgi:hypothetical protein